MVRYLYMTTWKLSCAIAIVGVALGLAFQYGYQHYYFVRLWWWDIPMHLGGGALAGLIGAWCAAILRIPVKTIHFVTGGLILGLGVEVVEYVTGFGRSPFMSYELDTMKDILNDVIGAVVARYVAYFFV